ncbi:acyl-CoA dehydrogenase family protein [Variovorax ginsengisoli]|uniref:Alkylation response protein AidB-like acyl-CoA dehydrogenase n=1 Tax=Variovorax ginsengisoli TaxID=363844 RepID=A0ABT9SEN7_9BURK|nr:acyl-CoA dehydrogenase family protein [Variovorax ginsengisoli]MDP9902818.1 alkylation response protein AidB-like acyl-CoA dehydrogenase [Variovorax ginsengisoli]
MSTSFPSLFPGMLLDAADRYAADHAAQAIQGDPVRELGWTATLVPEDAGGVGGSLRDLASIVEGLATHGLQLPVVETCAVVPLLLQAAGAETARRWLEAVAEGSAQIAPLTALSAMPDDNAVAARHLDIGFELDGAVQGVDLSLPATHYLVPAQVDGEDAIFLVDAERIGAPNARYRTMEGRAGADFRLARLAVPAGACIARGDAARDALSKATDAALLLTATDTVAALATLVRETVTHLKERRQFGVALSSFQVLRHRVADMYVKYLGAKGLVIHCLHAHEQDAPDLRRTLRLAKVSLAESARACAESAIQMHGGMGVSEEVLATRIAQRLIASEFRYGDRLLHVARLLAEQPAVPSLSLPANHIGGAR